MNMVLQILVLKLVGLVAVFLCFYSFLTNIMIVQVYVFYLKVITSLLLDTSRVIVVC